MMKVKNGGQNCFDFEPFIVKHYQSERLALGVLRFSTYVQFAPNANSILNNRKIILYYFKFLLEKSRDVSLGVRGCAITGSLLKL